MKGHERQEKTVILSQITGDQGDLTTKFNVRSWIKSWNRKKGFYGKLVV